MLVIGAGPAGCAAGIAAARAGASVTVLDRAVFPDHKICGDAISNKGARLVGELCGNAVTGLPHARVEGAAVVFPDGSRIGRSYGTDPGYIVPRRRLDAALREALEGSGAKLRQGARVRRLELVGGRVSGAETDSGSFAADAVIAADGYGSVAFGALGIPRRRGVHVAFGVTAYFEGVRSEGFEGVSAHYLEADLPYGYAWIFPEVEGLANVGVFQRSDQLRKGGVRLKDLLGRFVSRRRERFDGARMVGRMRARPLPLCVEAVRHTIPGLLVAGDAAHAVDPFTGEGIWQALRTGLLAGEACMDLEAVRRYESMVEREIVAPSASRSRIQAGVQAVVSLRLYRLGLARKAIEWAYRRGSTEITKVVE